MKAKLITLDNNKTSIITWQDPVIGMGQVIFNWDDEKMKYVVDTELLGIETLIKIIKSLE